MKQKKASQRDEQMLKVIQKEWELVIIGKPAIKLQQLLESYELDPLCSRNCFNQALKEKFVQTYILSGDYKGLGFYLKRNAKGVRQAQELSIIAELGKKEQLKELGVKLNGYVQGLQEDQNLLKVRIRTSVLEFILSTLAKYYVTIQVSDLRTIIDCSEEQIIRLGHRINGAFLELERKKELSSSNSLLKSKLKELAFVASKMSAFQ